MPSRNRLHLVELEDLPFFPVRLRDFVTDFLSTLFAITRPYDVINDLLRDAIVASKATKIVDLCSGAGVPALRAHREVTKVHQIKLLLTDKFPNQNACRRYPTLYRATPLDIVHDPIPDGFRTLFTAFHHFEPSTAQNILGKAVHDQQPIALFETTDRSLLGLLSIMLVPHLVLLLTPFIKPWRWDRCFLTYVIPLIPFCVFWDGLVSTFRSYTEAELLDFAEAFPAFTWSAGSRRGICGIKVTYLIGLPRETPAAANQVPFPPQ